MYTERNEQTNAIHKKDKFIMCFELQKLILLGKFSMRLCFYADSTQNKIMKHSVNHLPLKKVAQPFELKK